jgi:hypothetical protein
MTSLHTRRAGVLLHITSLPGPHGIGDLGPDAFRFVDWLAQAGQRIWQLLPTNPIGPGNSPYQSVSAFAGSPLMVALEPLIAAGWLPTPALPGQRIRRDAGRFFARGALALGTTAGCVCGLPPAADVDSQTALQRLGHGPTRLAGRLQPVHGAGNRAHGAPWWQWPAALRDRDAARSPPHVRRMQRRSPSGASCSGASTPSWPHSSATPTRAACDDGRSADLHRPSQRRLLGAPRPVFPRRRLSADRGRRLPAGCDGADRPALGQPAVSLGPHGEGRLRLVDGAPAPRAGTRPTCSASITSAASPATTKSPPTAPPPTKATWLPGPGKALFDAINATSASCRSSPRTSA